MLKQILLRQLLIILALSVMLIVTPESLLAQNAETDLLTSLSVIFDGFLLHEEEGIMLDGDFQIIRKHGAHYAVSNLNLYYGVKKVGKWEKALTQHDISIINDFLKDIEKTAVKIDVASFNNDGYSVDFAGKHWDINPGCNIFKKTHGHLAFPTLKFYTIIFKDQLLKLRHDRESHLDRVNELLFRKWYYDADQFKLLKKGSILSFSAKPNNNTTANWEFDKSLHLNVTSNTVDIDSIDVSLQYHAQESVTNYMYLAIYENSVIKRADNSERALQNHSFYIKELTEEVLILQIAY